VGAKVRVKVAVGGIDVGILVGIDVFVPGITFVLVATECIVFVGASDIDCVHETRIKQNKIEKKVFIIFIVSSPNIPNHHIQNLVLPDKHLERCTWFLLQVQNDYR